MEEADKIYNNIAREETKKIITNYSGNILHQNDEQDHNLQRQAVSSQIRMYTEEYTFGHSELGGD